MGLIDVLNLVRICRAHRLVSRPVCELTVSAVQQCIIQLGVCHVSHAPLIINDELILVSKFIPQMLHFRALNVCWSVFFSQAGKWKRIFDFIHE